MKGSCRVALVVAATWAAFGCGRGASPQGPDLDFREDPVFQLLQSRQRGWCQQITGATCWVILAPSREGYAAWVDWSRSTPTVFWNERVLTDRQFWITDPRMAHEACHLKHGWQPTWSLDQMEGFADHCAIQYTGAAP